MEVTNIDMAWVKEGVIEVGIKLNTEGSAVQTANCSILPISRLEDIPAEKAA